VLTIAAYDRHVEQLFDVLRRLSQALDRGGIEYRLVGGLAVFVYVHERDPLAARSTRDVDVAIDRRHLTAVAEAARPFGFLARHAAGVDLLVDIRQPTTRSAVHFVFVGEKVRPEYLEPVPPFSAAVRTSEGVVLAPIADLVRMKLTSFRLRDQVHLKDLDSVGLITADIERGLPEPLVERLRKARAAE
jgi:hypothetical protein